MDLAKEQAQRINHTGYHLESIEPVLEENRFNDAKKMLKDGLCIWSWHGTNSPTKINSIIKHGYLMPGDIHPETGQIICMSTGNW